MIEWYSGCDGHTFDLGSSLGRGDAIYLVRDDTDGWRPSAEELAIPHRILLDREPFLLVRLLVAGER